MRICTRCGPHNELGAKRAKKDTGLTRQGLCRGIKGRALDWLVAHLYLAGRNFTAARADSGSQLNADNLDPFGAGIHRVVYSAGFLRNIGSSTVTVTRRSFPSRQ